MASDTRVGLLVGLMFIVAFGLVLSEMTGSVPSSLAPSQDQLTRQNIWTPTVMPILPSREEITIEPVVLKVPVLAEPGVPEKNSEKFVFVKLAETVSPPADDTNNSSLLAAALTNSTELKTAPAKAKRYTVKPGDSLAMIAKHFYGSEHLYKLIYQANKAQLTDEALLQVGQVLLIPSANGGNRPVGQNHRQMALDELAQRFGSDASNVRPRRVYVVRPGDNLTRIARKVFNDGSPSAIKRLFDANRDKLPNPDALQVGTRLVIPS